MQGLLCLCVRDGCWSRFFSLIHHNLETFPTEGRDKFPWIMLKKWGKRRHGSRVELWFRAERCTIPSFQRRPSWGWFSFSPCTIKKAFHSLHWAHLAVITGRKSFINASRRRLRSFAVYIFPLLIVCVNASQEEAWRYGVFPHSRWMARPEHQVTFLFVSSIYQCLKLS